jgi:hypothetical protein
LATPGFGYHPPIAVTGPNQVVYDEVALDGSSSYDTDGTIESYAWVLEGIDNEYDRTAEGPNPTVSDLEHGFYLVTLTVTDNDGYTGTDTMFLGANHQCGPPPCEDSYGDGQLDGVEDTNRNIGVESSDPVHAASGSSGGGGGGCFIATAAFGSPMEAHVTILKNLRDNYLLPSALGRLFVRIYYKYSPPLANFITKHESLKTAVRIGLMPLVAISYTTLHFGPVFSLTMIVVFLVTTILLVSFCRRRTRGYRANN